ncbi:DUF4398 domain-containing protein [Dokdonella sp.]|uniref:DUF4398 domain-containing protein n=1 Tax=Dokdonella sp. TaxID=2291710 RepID=UPI0031CB550A|nr:kinetochore protein SPC24 [Dokdonella sp.]
MCALAAACTPTRPPVDQLDAASRALGVARDAGAPGLASTTYRTAGLRFDAAQAAEADGDYAAAAQLAAESQVTSELATAQARLASLREQADQLQRENIRLERQLEQAPDATQVQP